MVNELDVMRILRLPPRGKLVVEVGNKRYDKLSDVAEAEVSRRLIAAIGELIVFAGGYKVLVDAGVAPSMAEPPSAAQVTKPAQTDKSDLADLEARQTAFLEALERQRDAIQLAAATAPKSRLPTLLGNRSQPVIDPPSLDKLGAASEPLVTPKLSIVEQIDAILQRHLAAEPKLRERAIHLEQSPTGGLRIVIDGKYYERPGQIEEREVQLLIKMALKEWEAS